MTNDPPDTKPGARRFGDWLGDEISSLLIGISMLIGCVVIAFVLGVPVTAITATFIIGSLLVAAARSFVSWIRCELQE